MTVDRTAALDPSAHMFTVYGAEKTLAERVVWEFAEKYPEVEFTTSEQDRVPSDPI